MSSRLRTQNRLANQIEAEHITFFGKSIKDEFQEEDYQLFRQATLLALPSDFESIILNYLGKSVKYKKFVEHLKSSPSFQEVIQLSSVKPIHKLPEAKIELGKNTNLIYSLPLNPYIEWNLDSIIKQIGEAERKLIRTLMETSSTFEQFLQKIQDYFLDFCIRKLDVTEIVFNINRIAFQSSIQHNDLKQILRQLTCPDFVRLYSHFYHHRPYFGYILSRLGLPLPILFMSKVEKEVNQYFHPQILSMIIRQNNYILITNIGSNKMKGKGKTSFLKKFFLLKEKHLSSSNSSFHSSSVDFYCKIPHKIKGKDIMIADFHGDMKQNPKYQQLLKKCLENSTIVFLHLNEREVNCEDYQKSSFLNEFNQVSTFISQKAITLLIARDYQAKSDCIIENVGSSHLVKFPSLNDSIKAPNVANLCELIYKFMQDYSKQLFLNPTSFLSGKDLQRYQQDEKDVQSIMTLLLDNFEKNKQNFYESIFPNLECELKKLHLKQKIIKYEQHLRQSIDEQCHEMLRNYNQSKETLERMEREHCKPTSTVINEALRLLEGENKFKIIYLLSDKLSIWREKESDTFIKFIISKNAQFSNLNRSQGNKEEKQELKNIIKRAQISLQKYDISVDTIISEVIASLEKSEDKMKTKEAEIIFKYYDQAYKNLNPINLIEGKTLSFGNPFLQHFLVSLQKIKYENKKVFVASVIGAQSSAKSTILNYIFRCNFATSVGRCTKGVYFTIVECEDKVIVVIDTEGLLSVAARDHTFDVQIACFVMLISDLVIINNKGEVNAVLRDLLGVCVYAIDQLNSIEQGSVYQANRVIFTIRDQVQYGGNKQNQMLAMIIRALNENCNVNYTKYIDFSEKDIYPLQSAFISDNVGAFCLEGANNSFGKSIISLRGRIIQMLKTPKNNSLVQFYLNAERIWCSIQHCGENIFNFKSIYEIKTKEQIKSILQKVKKEYCGEFLEKQKLIIQSYKSDELVERQIQIEQELKSQYFKFKQSILQIFHKRCEEKVAEQQFIKDFQHEIEQFCTLMYRDSTQNFKKCIQQKRIETQNENFKNQIRLSVKQLYAKGRLEEDIIVEYEAQMSRLNEGIAKQISILQEKHNNLGRNDVSRHIINKVEHFLLDYYNTMKIRYLTLDKLKEEYRQVQCSKSRKEFKLVQMYKMRTNQANEVPIPTQDKQTLIIMIYDFLTTCQELINRVIKEDFQAIMENLNAIMFKIVDLINETYARLIQSSKDICSKYQIKLQNSGIVVARFISILPQRIQKNYFDVSKINLENKMRRQGEQMRQLITQLKESFSIRGDNRQIGKVWLKRILDRELDRYVNYHKQVIESELNKICSIINPKDIIKMAFASLNSSEIRSKERWLQCFKIVKNTNRCLKEYLYDRVEFKELKNRQVKIQNDTIHQMQLYLKEKFRKEVENVIAARLQSTIEHQNDDEARGIDYYEEKFGIDLFAYKKDDINVRLTEILFCVLEIARSLDTSNKEYEYFNQHIINQFKERMAKLIEHINVFTTQMIEPNVIGCQARCPGCGMKCFKLGDHADGHQLLKETHLMQCFNGKVYYENGIRSSDMCFTASSIINRQVFLPDLNLRVPVLTYIQDRYPQWYEHYLDKSSYNTKSREKECNVIWANIQYVIIRYKFKEMIPDPDIRQYEYDPLDDQDIIRLRLEEY